MSFFFEGVTVADELTRQEITKEKQQLSGNLI